MTTQGDREPRSPDDVVIPLAAEELRVEVREVPTGRVVVRTTVDVREEVIDLPLSREEVEVERVAINRVVPEVTPVRQEGDTTIVPVFEEVLVVEKRLLLKEEVRIVRRRTEERRPQRVTVRREEASVERLPAGGPAPPEGGRGTRSSNQEAGKGATP
jgi:uncharacterized protein (TIGR02271 family)